MEFWQSNTSYLAQEGPLKDQVGNLKYNHFLLNLTCLHNKLGKIKVEVGLLK